MSLNKNHEGYLDMTACIAIRRADQSKKRIRGNTVPLFHRIRNVKSKDILTYKLKELKVFQEAVCKMEVCDGYKN